MRLRRLPTIDITLGILLFLGIVLEIVFFLGLANKIILGIVFVGLTVLTLNLIIHAIQYILQLNLAEKVTAFLIFNLLLINFIPVFTPEVGFDALWYHLPIIKTIVNQAQITFIPNLYQSLNPLFAEFYFATGFVWLGDTGAKLVAYIFGLFLLLTTYKLSRLKLSKLNSLLITFVVAGFQVVAWQSSSAYVDVAKAFFELAGLYFCFKQISLSKKALNPKLKWSYLLLASLFFSASLATKLFSILMLPLFILVIIYTFKPKRWQWLVLLFLPILASPFYLFAFNHSGNPFYALTIHLNKLGEIGHEQNLSVYLGYKTLFLPKSLINYVTARDYTWPFGILFIPLFFIKLKKIIQDKIMVLMLGFVIFQWLVWWFIPPLSTRYALSGFILLLILGVMVVNQYYQRLARPLMYLLILSGLVLMAPRIYTLTKKVPYLVGKQTKQEYVRSFYDGNIDTKIQSWYGELD